MKITDALLGEHGINYILFSHTRDTVDNSHVLQGISNSVSVLGHVLMDHVQVEDDLLFPKLEPYLGQIGPLAVMRMEHHGPEDLLEKSKNETDVRTLKFILTEFLDLRYSHFRKEEMLLFCMAQQILDKQKLIELGQQWADSRDVTIDGHGCLGAT